MASFSLLVKLVAATVLGAAALLSHDKLRRAQALYYLHRNILRNACTVSPPPIVLVLGFRSHGKSAFINTACRVLSGEEGPLVLRSETAPPGTPPGSPVTRSDRVVSVSAGGCWEGREEEEMEVEEDVVVVEMVDTPGFSPLATGNVKEEVAEVLTRRTTTAPVAECVVVVVKCPGVDAKKKVMALKKMAELAIAVREHGLSVVVVLTHKEAMKSAGQVEELRKEAAAMARTDCVYVIDNYTTDAVPGFRAFPPATDFETHFSVLAVVRQCMEYTMIHRQHHHRQQQYKEGR